MPACQYDYSPSLFILINIQECNYFSHPYILILPHSTFCILFIAKPSEESCILRVPNSFPLYSLLSASSQVYVPAPAHHMKSLCWESNDPYVAIFSDQT